MFYHIIICNFIIDQWTKSWVMQHFYLGESMPIVQNIFHMTYIINRGAAFGMLEDQRIFFLVVVAVLLAVYWYFHKHIQEGPNYLKLGASLLISGALGNAYDRYTMHGVVDFFDFRIWPIFNVADISICVGVVLVSYYVFTKTEE